MKCGSTCRIFTGVFFKHPGIYRGSAIRWVHKNESHVCSRNAGARHVDPSWTQAQADLEQTPPDILQEHFSRLRLFPYVPHCSSCLSDDGWKDPESLDCRGSVPKTKMGSWIRPAAVKTPASQSLDGRSQIARLLHHAAKMP